MIDTARSQHGSVALVFCGGKGTRMQPITSLMQKEMLPVGPRRRPLLDHIVEHIKSHGIRDIVFVGSDKQGGDVANYFGNGRRFGVRAVHHPDPPTCGGTGHALLWAIRRLNLNKRDLLVYYGDMLNAVDLKEFQETHKKKDAIATVVVSKRYILPKGIASLTSGGMVDSFQEKPRWPGPGQITVGLLYLNADRMIKACGGLPSTLEQLRVSPYRDIMADIVKSLVSKREVAAYTTEASWRDLGSFQDYIEVQKESARNEFAAVLGKAATASPTEPGFSVFLSYHISDENQMLVENLLSRCLKSAGYGVVSGANLNRTKGVTGPPAARARQLIDGCDGLVAIATPVGNDRKPSTYVVDEVTYAHTKKKPVLLFIEEGTKVPGHWHELFTWTAFRRTNAGELARDVLEQIANAE